MSNTVFFGMFFIAVVLFVSMQIDRIWDKKFENDISKECERRQKQIDFKVGPE